MKKKEQKVRYDFAFFLNEKKNHELQKSLKRFRRAEVWNNLIYFYVEINEKSMRILFTPAQ